MRALIRWLETSFAPRMSVVNNNTWIVSVKDAIMQVLPFIFVGSVFAMLAILNDYIDWLPSFWTPYGWTMGIISLLISFLIPFNVMEKKRLRKQRIVAGSAGTALFLIAISPQVIADGAPGFGHAALGAGGMFVAIATGLITSAIMMLFRSFTFFKEDSAVPDFVRAWFDAMLPVASVVVFGWVLIDIVGFDLYNIVLAIFQPLAAVIESPWGFALAMFVFCFLYSMGISSWVLTPVFTPVTLAAIQANMDGTAENLVTATTIYSTYLWIGGIGATWPLVIMMMRSRSVRLKALGRASFVPAIFNINEPVVFGAVAWNPTLMIPMWLQGIVLAPVVWLFTKTIPFAPVPMTQFELWYTPFPLAPWLTTGSITGVILCLAIFSLSALIWFPFFKAYEHQLVASEAQEAATTAGTPVADPAADAAVDAVAADQSESAAPVVRTAAASEPAPPAPAPTATRSAAVDGVVRRPRRQRPQSTNTTESERGDQ